MSSLTRAKPLSITPTFTPLRVMPAACQREAPWASVPWLVIGPRWGLGGMIAWMRKTPGRFDAATSRVTGT